MKKITTEQKNLEFKKLSKPEQRIAIAQDVLDQIKAKRYIATSGRWISFEEEKGTYLSQFSPTDSIQGLFEKKELTTCQCCGLGALFMSCINLNNNTTVENYNYESDDLATAISEETLSNGLNEIFSYEQLRLIESYFEGADGAFLDDKRNAINFYYENCEEERLKLVMENIIENEGTFVPSKLKDFEYQYD